MNAKLRSAIAIAMQLRCQHEFSLSEREGVGVARRPPIGDRVLEAESTDLLTLVSQLPECDALERRIDQNWVSLRSMYGYDAPIWSDRVAGKRYAPRVVARIGICLAADATFAPYARGLLDAIRARQSTLRIDFLSAARTVWAWGSADHRALARCLNAARTSPDGSDSVGFPAFTALYQRIIGDHLESNIDDESRSGVVRDLADRLSVVTVNGLAQAGMPGRTADGNLFTPIIGLVAAQHPDWLPDDREIDAEEALASGAAPLVFEALAEQKPPTEIAAALDALRRGLLHPQTLPSDA
ncbi:MAG TPA: hypothetical protein VG652_07655 [Gaiellaceae bacterium]|nr:hypothetical protein [Gaiellaceae bacterium]